MADKPEKLEAWALGLLGVNVVDGPLHLVDGELTRAQNAEPFTEEGEGGIRKRLGIDEFSGAALGAAIAAITSVPLPDPFTPLATRGTRLYVTTESGANTHLSSTDGITWIAGAPFARPWGPIGNNGLYNDTFQHGAFLSTTGALYYLAVEDPGGAQGDFLALWNGSIETILGTIPLSDGVPELPGTIDDRRTMLMHDGQIYLVGDSGFSTYILRFVAGEWEGVHNEPGYEPFVAASAWGRLWIPSHLQEMGYWSEDDGFVNQGIFTGNAGATMPPADMLMTPWGLFVGLDRAGQDPELVWRLAAVDGTWENMTPVTATTGCWGPMALFDNALYIARHSSPLGGGGVAYSGAELWKFDGTSMTLVKDLATVVTNAVDVRSMIVFNDALYLVVRASSDPTRNVVRTVDGVTFTVPVAKNTADGDRPRGEIGFY